MNRKLRVAVLMGGPSAEREVSLKTGLEIMKALSRDKYESREAVVPQDVKRWRFENDLLGADVALLAMHGPFGEDGTLQAVLETLNIPYTGSGVLASALAMDKARSAHLFAFHGLKVPRQIVFDRDEYRKDKQFVLERVMGMGSLPCVVKPVGLGSSVGVSVVRTIQELPFALTTAFDFDSRAMAEEYIDGAEVTCGVLDEGGGREPLALPPTLIKPKQSRFFDYAAKYTPGLTEEITPAPLAPEAIDEIKKTALTVHLVLGCFGLSRTDMILKGGNLFVLETNTLPGMTATSLYPQEAAAAGIEFPDLLDRLIQSALRRQTAVSSRSL